MTPTDTTPAQVLAELKSLRQERVCDDSGICWNLAQRLSVDLPWERESLLYLEVSTMVSEMAESWPGFSGDGEYPVPHPELSPTDAYLGQDLWNPETQYGRNRQDLLEFLIAKFEAITR